MEGGLFTNLLESTSQFAFLVKKKIVYTWILNHTAGSSTWTHAEHVMKNDFLTLKQAHKNVANIKSNRIHLQSCGIL